MKKNFFIVLFLLWYNFLFSFTFNHSITNIWSNKTGTALGFSWNFQEKLQKDKKVFAVTGSLFYGNSSLDILSTSFIEGDFCFNYKNPFFAVKTNFGLAQTDNITVSFQEEFSQKNFQEFHGKLETDFFVKDLLVSPFAALSTFSTKDGDLYYFYGNIHAPFMGHYGINLHYKNHRIEFSYLGGKIDIQNDDEQPLFYSVEKDFHGGYYFSFKKETWQIQPYISYDFFIGEFIGSLTSANQGYFLFPYRFYNLEGQISTQIVCLGTDFLCKKNNWDFLIHYSTQFFVQQKGFYNADWQYKNNIFFDGSSGNENSLLNYLNLAGVTCIKFANSYNFYSKKINFKLNFAKNIVLPFQIPQKSDSPSNSFFEKYLENVSVKDFIISYLFSGLSLSFSLNF
ncbi:MAG: hypothetical protein E7062_03300 [Spirochaetaceae bacterium]|nr:hypothetical protein [Spirochaetaceae bacterium]